MDGRGIFIAFEGIDGSGKSLQISRLFESLASDLKVDPEWLVLTREPGDIFRKVIKEGIDMDAGTETLLFMADRNEHVGRVINPSLDQGKMVLTDRYHMSTLAYQCWGKGVGFDIPQMLFRAQAMPTPDLTILLDVPSAVAARRVGARGASDRFEKDPAFMERVRNGYLEIASRPAMFKIPTAIVDGTAAPEVVSERIMEAICERLGGRLRYSGLIDSFATGTAFAAAEKHRNHAMEILTGGGYVEPRTPVRSGIADRENERSLG